MYRQKSIDCFIYLNNKYPNFKFSSDRLGRTALHYIIQYNLFECLPLNDLNDEDYFTKDSNGDSPLDYCFIYNADKCLLKIFENKNFAEYYKILRNYHFAENCLI